MRRMIWSGGLVLTLTIVLAGCSKQEQLFPENAYRTQYERFELLRGQQRQLTRTNVYGKEEPNLKERLRPLQGP